MEKYILRLLEENNRVILPDIGAFSISEEEEQAVEEESSFSLDETIKEVDIDASGDFITQPPVDKTLAPPEITRDQFILDETSNEEQDTIKHGTTGTPSAVSYETTKSKKRKWISPLIISGTTILIIIVIWFFLPDSVRHIFQAEKTAGENIISPENIETFFEESTGIDFQDVETGNIEEASLPPAPPGERTRITEELSQGTTITTIEKKYYIVAGCFEHLENAERYTKELQAKGYNAGIFGTRENLYTVSFNSFATKAQALEEMYRIRQTTEPEAWVLYY